MFLFLLGTVLLFRWKNWLSVLFWKAYRSPFLLFIVSMQISISSPNNWPDETGTALYLLGLFWGKSWDFPLLSILQHLTWRQTPPLPSVLMTKHQQCLVPSLHGPEAVEECDPGGGIEYTHTPLCAPVAAAGKCSWSPHLAYIRYPQLNKWSQNYVPVVVCFVKNCKVGVVLVSWVLKTTFFCCP